MGGLQGARCYQASQVSLLCFGPQRSHPHEVVAKHSSMIGVIHNPGIRRNELMALAGLQRMGRNDGYESSMGPGRPADGTR